VTPREDIAAATVRDVLAAHLRVVGAPGLVVATTHAPETELLRRWLGADVPVRLPAAALVERIVTGLGETPEGRALDMETRTAVALESAARVTARSEGLVPADLRNRLGLLLDPAPPAAGVIPLGDVHASDIHRWTGSVTLPPAFAGWDMATVRDVENALDAYLIHGYPPDEAMGCLGPRAVTVGKALDDAAPGRLGLLVPKLHAWTVGVDLAR